MADVIISSTELSVLGGPSEISVSVDVGPAGSRGSTFFTGNGKPTDQGISFPSTGIQANDLYINTKQSDPEYLDMYQYTSINSVLQWQKIVSLIPYTGFYNTTLSFVSGVAKSTIGSGTSVPSIFIPIASMLDLETFSNLSYTDLNVQLTIESDVPVSYGVTLSEITDTYVHNGTSIALGALYLPVAITGIKYASNAWANIGTSTPELKKAHFTISVGGN